MLKPCDSPAVPQIKCSIYCNFTKLAGGYCNSENECICYKTDSKTTTIKDKNPTSTKKGAITTTPFDYVLI